MGHRDYGELPETQNWEKVVKLLSTSQDPERIAAATYQAAKRGLEIAKKDRGFTATVYCLIKFVWASQKPDYTDAIQQLSIWISPDDKFLDVVAAFDEGVNHRLRRIGHRTDLAEMARLAATETVVWLCQNEQKPLWDAPLENTVKRIRKYATADEFTEVGKCFFGNFLFRFLDYHLSREIPNHVGKNKTFGTVTKALRFKDALEEHCYKTAGMVQNLSRCWPSQFNDQITEENIRDDFVRVAFNELNRLIRK